MAFCMMPIYAQQAPNPTATPQPENCDLYYQKAFQQLALAERIDGDGLIASALRGGTAGLAAAYTGMYNACLIRNHYIEIKPRP